MAQTAASFALPAHLNRARAVLLAFAVLAVGASLAALATGPAQLGVDRIVTLHVQPLGIDTGIAVDPGHSAIFWSLRLPRLFVGFLVGAGLAVAGTLMQGLSRNPLADPGLLGASGGAGAASVSVIVLGGGFVAGLPAGLQPFALPVAAFLGAMAATAIVYRIGTRAGRTVMATLLLAGIAVGTVAQAQIGFMVFISDDTQLRVLNFWLLGGLAGALWTMLLPLAAFVCAGLAIAMTVARPLNTLALGESEAGHLGTNVQGFKRLIAVIASLMVGAAVAVAGIIGFVGLVVPHIVRRLTGPDHRYVLPGSALLGGGLLVLADIFARTVVAPAELPIGIVTAAIGGPFFIFLLLRHFRGAI
ncbi:MAG: FecCD family ABC transporter permease [Alphaproteobacteria bacterium]